MLLLIGASSSLGAANAGGTRPAPDDININQQTSTCTGVVKDPSGETVIGASVVVKGTTNGTITGIDGDFSIPNVKKGDVIQISYIGFQTIEVVYEGQPLNVTLSEDSQMLGEVVVTALGIKREKKSLGYAMQEVKGESLVNARETNLANALSGKIAGVQVIRSSNGPGGSSKIQLRGANSVTGTNQPLIVVDGVPMDNFTGADNADFYNPSLDMGNGLSDINPEDIESMSVLKGASAAALYGSRAGNGVILITTKKGVKKEGLGARNTCSTARAGACSIMTTSTPISAQVQTSRRASHSPRCSTRQLSMLPLLAWTMRARFRVPVWTARTLCCVPLPPSARMTAGVSTARYSTSVREPRTVR